MFVKHFLNRKFLSPNFFCKYKKQPSGITHIMNIALGIFAILHTINVKRVQNDRKTWTIGEEKFYRITHTHTYRKKFYTQEKKKVPARNIMRLGSLVHNKVSFKTTYTLTHTYTQLFFSNDSNFVSSISFQV